MSRPQCARAEKAEAAKSGPAGESSKAAGAGVNHGKYLVDLWYLQYTPNHL